MPLNRLELRSWRRKHRGAAAAPALLALLLSTACQPHRVDPAPAPLTGGTAYPIGTTDETAGAAPWWSALDDARLDALISRALHANHDVAAARERIRQALAARRRADAASWPEIEGELGLTREVYADGRERQGTRRRAGASLDWEADVFGRLRYTAQAREAEAWARIHDAEAFRLRLSVEVAEAHYGILEQTRLLELLDEQIGTSNELSRIIEQRYEEGLISNLDVLQQRTQSAELESQVPVARAALHDELTRLGALLGAAPADGAPERAEPGADFPVIAPLPRLERADLLLARRPDLRAARAALVAADAETGRALAERLPRLSLSADALRTEGGGATISSIGLGAELIQPLLDWGARRADWVRAGAVYRERLAAFSQTYLRAAWEVESLVENERFQRELLESLGRRRALLEATIKQARSRYDAGLTDYLPVLSATQQFYSVEQRLVRERRRLTSLRVALHGALGGPTPADPAAPALARPTGSPPYSFFRDENG